ncbi:hypothetical protein F5887DRAFT_205311 [Amanita rubescens]|nr:hypothetical protein F5887DRAFT_205311 [Amanita rubescens]
MKERDTTWPAVLSPGSLSHRQPHSLSLPCSFLAPLLYPSPSADLDHHLLPCSSSSESRHITMRRFVKALSFKRDKQDDSEPTQDASSANGALVTTRKGRKSSHSLRIKSFTSISSSTQAPAFSPITSSPSTPQLSVNSDHPHSSSASSSAGSVENNPQTPDDEHMGGVPSTLRNKWNMAWPDSPSISHAIRPSDVSPLLHRTAEGEPKADFYDILDDMLTGS